MSQAAYVRKYGDAIDTDVIIPARYLTSRDPQFLASHCMEGVDTRFASRISKGDVMVAGQNFGCGSSREHAVIALLASGISCVVAKSYARIFYRNAINQGLTVLTCPALCDAAQEGQAISVDLQAGTIDLEGVVYRIDPIPGFLQDIIRLGGIVPFVQARLQQGQFEETNP